MFLFTSCWSISTTIGLESGANTEKVKDILRIISAVKLPYLILGDFNVPPEECGASAFFSYLSGTILAADVDHTCTSSGTDRVLDYGIASKELADCIHVFPFYQHPFKPHVVGLDFYIHLQMEPDLGYVLELPQEIAFAAGPREVDDDWWKHFNRFADFEPHIEAPCAQGSDALLTRQYARWSRAAESHTVSTIP